MSNPWIVEPKETEKTITLEWVVGGEVRPLWLKVRTQLSVGEKRKMLKAVSSVSQPLNRGRGEQSEASARFEWTDYSFARMCAYIVDWSLAHDPLKENRLPPVRASFEALKQEPFDLIDDALDAHERGEQEEKKA